MAKYLDYAGLQYLWAKIKNYVSTQPLGANVRYDQQTLTPAQQSQARANIRAGGSNRNLLDNPWFTAGNVVNQRGVATIQHTQYGIDRWKGEHRDATITVTNAGLAYQGTSADLYQPIESSLRTFLNGKTLTASVLKSDGTIESGSAVFTNGAKTQFIYNSATGADVFISAAGNFNLRYLNHTSAATVVACKLELGSVSTLANDAPPDYGEELTRCIYSTADPSDTYANNGFGRTNPNLLDNPFFTINQRGFTTSTETNNIFSVDRWLINNGGGTITKTANGIKINNTSGTRYNTFQQRFGADELARKTVTLSIDADGSIYKQTFTIPARTSSVQTMCNWAWKTGCNLRFFVETTSANASYNVQIYVANGYSTDLRAVKLELGSISTLANDAPPDYGEELAKCQRYFARIKGDPMGTGYIISNGQSSRILIPLPSVMRGVPSVSFNGTYHLRWYGNTSTVTTMTSVEPQFTGGGIVIACGGFSGATTGPCALYADSASSYIDISVDL